MLYNNHKVYFDKKGYALIWLNSVDKKIHILEWEKYNGKKPEGMQIHHKDNNKGNWDINNLELLSQSNHFRTHARWIRENGVWIKKPCKDCKKLLPLEDFYQRKGLTPSNRCILCSRIYFVEIAKNKDFKRRRREYMKVYYPNNIEKWKN